MQTIEQYLGEKHGKEVLEEFLELVLSVEVIETPLQIKPSSNDTENNST
jgi:hypothetical protein